jgi:hypothetical protein
MNAGEKSKGNIYGLLEIIIINRAWIPLLPCNLHSQPIVKNFLDKKYSIFLFDVNNENYMK